MGNEGLPSAFFRSGPSLEKCETGACGLKLVRQSDGDCSFAHALIGDHEDWLHCAPALPVELRDRSEAINRILLPTISE